MQSTGHSSMHARSSKSTQGRAMMYVTPNSSFNRAWAPACGAGSSIADQFSIAKPRAALQLRCRPHRVRRLSAERDGAARRRSLTATGVPGPALGAVRDGPLVALVADLPD